MIRLATILLFSTSLALADITPAVKDEPVPLRTMPIAAAMIPSPLFTGWAPARNRSKKPPK